MSLSPLLNSFSVYDLKMKRLQNSQDEDLFQLICSKRRYVVDSDCEWKKRSLNEPHTAFILGRTICNERDNLHGELFNDKILGGRANVFLFDVESCENGHVIVINRLDAHHQLIYKQQIPPLSGPNAEDPAKWNCPQKRLELRQRIAELMQLSVTELRNAITANKSQCLGNFELSCEIAGRCYALLLLEEGSRIKKEIRKFMDNDENLFGDTTLIRDALFFRADILSRDGLVKRMASSCSLRCKSFT